jgi:hypothetical protein
LLVTAMPLSLPALDLADHPCRRGDEQVHLATHQVLHAGPEPRYGMCVMKVPVSCLNSSPAMCWIEPLPDDA